MAREKIYDIRPKAKKKKTRRSKDSFHATALDKLLSLDVSLPKKKEKKSASSPKARKWEIDFSLKKHWLVVFGLVLACVAGVLHLSAKAEIEVWPKQRLISFEEEVVVDTEASQPKFPQGLISGQLVSKEGEMTRNFASTGSASEEIKAGGKIKVVNNYHLHQILVAKTRFLSADGQLFYLKEKADIPSGGSLEVEVEAAEPGPEYNIKPTNFSIPGLLGSPRYTAVYAESPEPMKGGYRGTVAQVISEDLERAREEVANALTSVLSDGLQKEVGMNFSLLAEGVETKVIEESSSAKAGDKTDDFVFSIKAEANAIAFKTSELQELAYGLASEEVQEDEEIEESSLKITPTIEEVNLKEGKLYLEIEASVFAAKKIYKSDLKRALSGKHLKESEMLLSSVPEVAKAKIRIFPFWVKKMPLKPERIEIILPR